MKSLWKILMEKLKDVDPLIAAAMILVTGLFSIGAVVSIITGFFEMISDIAIAFSGQPLG